MTYLIPDSVEASMSALIFACLNFSYDWGGKMIAVGLCSAFQITEDDMTNMPKAVGLKLGLLFVFLGAIYFLPDREELDSTIAELNKVLILKTNHDDGEEKLMVRQNEGKEDEEDLIGTPPGRRERLEAAKANAGSDHLIFKSALGPTEFNLQGS